MSDTSTSTTPEPTVEGMQTDRMAAAQWQDTDGLGIRLWVTHHVGEHRIRIVPVRVGPGGTSFDQGDAVEVSLPGGERYSRKAHTVAFSAAVADLDALLPDSGPLRARWTLIRDRVAAPGTVRAFL